MKLHNRHHIAAIFLRFGKEIMGYCMTQRHPRYAKKYGDLPKIFLN